MQKIVVENIFSGFEKTGIFQFNKDIIPKSRYAPISITDRPGFFNNLKWFPQLFFFYSVAEYQAQESSDDFLDIQGPGTANANILPQVSNFNFQKSGFTQASVTVRLSNLKLYKIVLFFSKKFTICGRI